MEVTANIKVNLDSKMFISNKSFSVSENSKAHTCKGKLKSKKFDFERSSTVYSKNICGKFEIVDTLCDPVESSFHAKIL